LFLIEYFTMKELMKKICVVGAGRWGKNHVKTLKKLGWLGGIIDNRSDQRAVLSLEFPEIPIYSNVRDSIKDGFDGYTVATPAETHYEIASYLLKNKKPVLVEKPLTLTSKESIELDSLANKNNTLLMVGHVMLFHPAIQKIKELIDLGKFGKLQYIYSNRLNLGTVRKEENILWSFAPHDISIFQYLIDAKPIEVISRGGAFLQNSIHDTTMTILTYPNNIVGHIFVSWLHPFKEHRIVIVGSNGMITFEDSLEGKPLLFYEKGIDWVKGEPIKRDGPTEQIAYDSAMPLTREIQFFHDNLDNPIISIANGKNAIDVLEILENASSDLIRDLKCL